MATHGIAAKYSNIIKESVHFEAKTRLRLSLSVLQFGSLEVLRSINCPVSMGSNTTVTVCGPQNQEVNRKLHQVNSFIGSEQMTPQCIVLRLASQANLLWSYLRTVLVFLHLCNQLKLP